MTINNYYNISNEILRNVSKLHYRLDTIVALELIKQWKQKKLSKINLYNNKYSTKNFFHCFVNKFL